jgi:NTE family protein
VATVSKVANVLMNAVMMDGLEADIQRMDQINRSMHLLNHGERKKLGFTEIENAWISPSVDFADVAQKRSHELPRMIRYLLRGPGSLDESGELLSYLLFTSSYCRQLIEIGFADGMKARDQIEELLLSPGVEKGKSPRMSI